MPNGVYRLISHHATLLFLDTKASRLRHGAPGLVPQNLVLEIIEEHCRFLYIDSDDPAHGHQLQLVSPQGFAHVVDEHSADFDLDVHKISDEVIGISLREAFLSSDLDGLVKNDKAWCREWEHYALQKVENLEAAAPSTIAGPPFFSIIIVTHSRPSLLTRSLGSVICQKFDSYEIIVVSDDDNRDTYDVAKKYLRKQDVFLKRNGHPGPARSRNMGLALSQGNFCLMLDDDDSYEPMFLQKLHVHITALQSDVFYFDYEAVEESRLESPPKITGRSPRLTNAESLESIMFYNFIPSNAFAISAAVAKHYRFDETLRSHEDWDFLVAMLHGGCTFTHIPISGVSVHIDTSSVHRNLDTKESRPLDFLQIYRRWPAVTEKQRERRHNVLKEGGYDISPSYL